MFFPGCQFPRPSHIDSALGRFRLACSILENPMQSPPLHEQDSPDNKRYQCLLCDNGQNNSIGRFQDIVTFTRHVTSKHYPDTWYDCPYGCHPQPNEKWSTRTNKHREHMMNIHEYRPLTRNELQRCKRPIWPPEKCPLCDKPVSGWPEFWNCIEEHCRIFGAGKGHGGWDGNDSDGDDDDENDGNDGGHQYYSPSGNGNGYTGNMANGSQFNKVGGHRPGAPSGGALSGTSPGQFYGAANDSCVSFDQLNSTKSGATKASKGAFDNLGESSQSELASSRKWPCCDAQLQETFRTEICLSPGSSAPKHHDNRDEFENSTIFEEHACDSEASILDKSETSRELDRSRYFEIRIFEDQKHGSLVTDAHETLIISQPGPVDSIFVFSIQGMSSSSKYGLFEHNR